MAYELEVTTPTSEKTQLGLSPPAGSVAGHGEEPIGGVYSFTATGHDITDRHIARLHPKIRESVSTFIRGCLSDTAIQKAVYVNESVRSASAHDALKKAGPLWRKQQKGGKAVSAPEEKKSQNEKGEKGKVRTTEENQTDSTNRVPCSRTTVTHRRGYSKCIN